MLGMNVKYICQYVGGTQLIVGSPNPKYTNRPCWSSKMRIIGELLDWLRWLCCFCRLGQCNSWTCALHFKSFWMVYAKLPCHFSLFCMPLLLLAITTTTATFTENLNQSQDSFKISHHDKISGQFLDSCFRILRVNVFANTILGHYSWTTFTKTVCILRTSSVCRKLLMTSACI